MPDPVDRPNAAAAAIQAPAADRAEGAPACAPAAPEPASLLHGVVVKVENLDVCRPFYSELLELGEPVMDSNFWVEFSLGGGASLILEKAMPGEKTPVGRGKIAWFLRAPDVKRLSLKLERNGHKPLGEEQERLGYKIHLFCDPEGNPFYLISDAENTLD